MTTTGPRADAARALVATGRRVTDLGLSPGSSGNVSVRVGDRVLMTPTGASLGDLDPDALSELTLDGELVGGPRPSKEFPFHTAFYRRDAETRAVVHLHSPHAAAVSLLPAWHDRSALPPLTPYFVMRVGQTPLVPYAHPGDDRQARHIEALPFAFRAVLLQNHGPVTSGASLEAALDAAVELEEVCRLALLTSGRPVVPLPDAAAHDLAERYGSAWDAVSS